VGELFWEGRGEKGSRGELNTWCSPAGAGDFLRGDKEVGEKKEKNGRTKLQKYTIGWPEST